MALIKSLGDQVRMVTMMEPGGVQLSRFHRTAFQNSAKVTEKLALCDGRARFGLVANAHCDLSGCWRRPIYRRDVAF